MTMSFLGSIGNMMKSSGIEDLFTEVYAENTFNNIMSVKAVSRALGAHFFTNPVLVTLSLEQIFDKDRTETKRFNEQLTEILQNDDIANKEAFLETEL